MRSCIAPFYDPFTTWVKAIKLAVLLTIPTSLIILPVSYFDTGTSISIFAFFGVEDLVYSTGMTRSIMHLIHGDVSGAMEFNKLGVIVLPMLMVLWAKMVLKKFGVRILRWF